MFRLQKRELAYLFSINEMHFGEILPGHVRGNHYHVDKKEMLIVRYADTWKLVWGSVDGLGPRKRIFEGKGTVRVEIDAGVPHAVKNEGSAPLVLISLSDAESAADGGDTVRFVLIGGTDL